VEGGGEVEGYCAVGARRAVGLSWGEILQVEGAGAGHGCEHVDGVGEEEDEPDGQAQDGGFVGQLVDRLVLQDQLHEFVAVVERHYQIDILFLVHSTLPVIITAYCQSQQSPIIIPISPISAISLRVG